MMRYKCTKFQYQMYFLFALLVWLFLQISFIAHAEEAGGNGEAGNGGQATMIVVGGPKMAHTGWLFYLVDRQGVQQTRTMVAYCNSQRPGSGHRIYEKTKFGGTIASYAENAVFLPSWNILPPFDEQGNGNGSVLKSRIVSGKVNIQMVASFFPEYLEAYVGQEEEYYLILEPFFWGQMYDGNKPSGTYLCATAKGWAETQNLLGYQDREEGAPAIKRYTNNVFPNCVRLQTPQFGLAPLSGRLRNSQIIESGNGFMTFWAVDKTTTLPQDSFFDTARRQLYVIANLGKSHDIDKAIPAGEVVGNRFEADCFYGRVEVEKKTASKEYQVHFVYKWQEKVSDGKYLGEDGLWHTKYKHVERQKENTVSFTAYQEYERIKRLQLYGLQQGLVRNAAFSEDLVYDKDHAESWPLVYPQVRVYGRDTAYGYPCATGIQISEEGHFGFPAAPAGGTKYVGSASGADAAIQNDIEWVKNQVYSNAWGRNDHLQVDLQVGENKVTYGFMSDQKIQGCYIPGYRDTKAANASTRYGGQGLQMDTVNPIRAKGQKEDRIPNTTDNGDYPTGVQVQYGLLAGTENPFSAVLRAGKGVFEGPMTEDIYAHVMQGTLEGTNWNRKDKPGGDGYDIKVHTPVVAPFMITDNYGQPQSDPGPELLDRDASATYQLKLDQRYMLKWNLDQWISAKYGEKKLKGYEEKPSYASAYDKYVEKKQVKFPFDVHYLDKFYQAGTWITVEEPSSPDNHWQKSLSVQDRVDYQSNNHWQMMPFYIPAYAKEGSGEIEVRVYAKNVEGRYEGSHNVIEAMELEKNAQSNHYIATYKVTEQVSGYLYGFTIIGVDDTDMYQGYFEEKGIYDRLEYSLVQDKQEKVSGLYNRLGEPYLRYLVDGHPYQLVQQKGDSFAEYDKVLPMTNGSNVAGQNKVGNGSLWLGSGFGFQIQTIGNFAGERDEIKIVPVFRISDKQGNCLDTLWRSDGQLYSEKNRLKVFYKEEDKYQDFMKSETDCRFGIALSSKLLGLRGAESDSPQPCYGNTIIWLSSGLRIFSGSWGQLAANQGKTEEEMISYFDWNQDGVLEEGIPENMGIMFHNAMQSWYGTYCMPGELLIYDNQNKDLEQKSYFTRKDFLEDYDIVMNFDVIAYQNGVPHLAYGGYINGPRQWLVEGYQERDRYVYGDVVVYDGSKQWSRRYEGHLINVN